MRVGQLVRIRSSNVEGEAGLFGTVRQTLHGGAGLYAIVGLPYPYGIAHMCATDLETVVLEDQEFVTVEGRYGVVLERKEDHVRIQFNKMVDWVDSDRVEPSSPDILLVNDVMTR